MTISAVGSISVEIPLPFVDAVDSRSEVSCECVFPDLEPELWEAARSLGRAVWRRFLGC